MRDVLSWFFSKYAESITGAIIIFVAFYILLWPVKIEGPDMATTINDSDWVLCSRFIAWKSDLQPGDVVILKTEREKKNMIRRIISTEGDEIEITDGLVFVNGKQLEEEYITSATAGKYKFILTEDSYFVMGDNRLASLDSRNYGPVTKENIESKVLLRIYPFKNITSYF